METLQFCPAEPQEFEAAILAVDIIDAVADHRGRWSAMVFASEMLVALAAKIEREVGADEARDALRMARNSIRKAA
jgi:hypothetical protein